MVSERVSSGHTSSGSDEVTREAVLRARAAIAEHERTVPDFPKPGILFRDLTPVLADTEGFSSIVTALTHGCSGVDLVAGIDARGFLVGGAVAQELEVGILAVRKGGKLPHRSTASTTTSNTARVGWRSRRAASTSPGDAC